MLEQVTADQYPGIDYWSKVKHLVNGIKTSALDTTKDTIWASATLSMNFEGTVGLFNTFITRQKTGSSGINKLRSESATQNGGGGCGG